MKLRPTTLAPALGCAALLALGTPGTAAAHGDTIHFAVGGEQQGGHVRTVATWENDGDPVDEPVAGTLTATGPEGRTAGPWQLVAAEGGKGAYTTRESLPQGTWKVVVHCGFPDLGHGEGRVTVAAGTAEAGHGPAPAGSAAAPERSAPAGPAAARREAAPPEAEEAPAASSRTGLVAGVCAAGAVAVAAAVFLRRAGRSGKAAVTK
ncbi:hypothetical protein FGW37_03910 [Streptomyces rectiverticillatus]|uniref:hypothetical protein n=1 Tax=Streptomyces rectiverticillatus TaxID=173860 RepID=UPI0015C31A54|nr:hypothetical protein [Streptomyces rectiverticillatus]QLE70859.1 hypothetical protein FGW37_03910 [Streptomyces rectiverticillatus]